MPLVVYSNGSLTREAVRDWGGVRRGWEEFESALERRPEGNDGVIGFHFMRPEIVPETDTEMQIHFDKVRNTCYEKRAWFLVYGMIRQQDLNDRTFSPRAKDNNQLREDHVDHATRVRAALEMRAMAIKHHTSQLGLPTPIRIVATGGGAHSKGTIQILSDVLECPVYTSHAQNSAGMGAAFRAYHGLRCSESQSGYVPFIEAIAVKTDIEKDLFLAAKPNPATQGVYRALLKRYTELERQLAAGTILPRL